MKDKKAQMPVMEGLPFEYFPWENREQALVQQAERLAKAMEGSKGLSLKELSMSKGEFAPKFLAKESLGRKLGRSLGKGALIGGGTVAALAAYNAAKGALHEATEPAKFQTAYGNMLEYDPSLKSYDPTQVEARFRTLRTFNKDMSEDPLVASSWVKQTIEYPVVTPETLRPLMQTSGDSSSRDIGKLVAGLMAGGAD